MVELKANWQEIDGMRVTCEFSAGRWWWRWRRISDGQQVHAGLSDEQMVCGRNYWLLAGRWQQVSPAAAL